MQQFDDTNRGVLFKNDKKEPGDKKPDYTGSIDVGGVDHFLDGWIRKSQAGKTFLSLSIKPKNAKPAQRPAQKPSAGFDDMDAPF